MGLLRVAGSWLSSKSVGLLAEGSAPKSAVKPDLEPEVESTACGAACCTVGVIYFHFVHLGSCQLHKERDKSLVSFQSLYKRRRGAPELDFGPPTRLAAG